NHFVPRPLQLNAGRPNVNSVRPNVNTGRVNVNSVRHNVNSVRSNVNTGRSKQPVPTCNSNSFSPVRPQVNNQGHMTGNKDHLDDFEEYKGGSVTFGGSKGYITGKGTLQSPIANASEEANEDEELIVVPTAIKHSAAKVGPRKSSPNSKEEKSLTELQNLQTQEKEAFSTGILEDTPEILAFRRDLDQLAQKHLREVTTDKTTSTNSVNSGSEPANSQPADQDDSDEFEALMKGRFQMSSMGELIFFLGLQVKQTTDEIFISQDKYVTDMLK
ncbi:hypothetical protein Tco_1374122, partial [Tanacetum coccineum]